MDKAREQVENIAEKRQNLSDKGYAPLMRFGRFWINVKDAQGNVVQHYRLETRRERNALFNKLNQNPDIQARGESVSYGEANEKDHELFVGVNPESVALFAQEAGLSMDDAQQAYYKLATSNHSASRRLIHRKGIEGYSEDLRRVLASFVLSNSRHAANILYGSATSGVLHEAILEVEPEGQWRARAQSMRERWAVRRPERRRPPAKPAWFPP